MGNKSIYLKLLDKPDKIIEMIEKNPVDLFKFYYSLLKENSYYKNNLEIFEYNIKKLYDIILNFNESSKKDFYISLSCIFGAFFLIHVVVIANFQKEIITIIILFMRKKILNNILKMDK